MYAEEWPVLLAAPARNQQQQACKILRLFPEVVNHFLREHTTDQAIAKYDVSVLRLMQPANIILQKCPYDLTANFYKVVDVYDEGTLNDVFIDRDDQSIRHSL